MEVQTSGASVTVLALSDNILTTASVPKVESTTRQVTVTEEDVVDLWRTIGASRNLTTDTDIARYLLSLYLTDKQDGGKPEIQCQRCSTPLTLFCLRCQLPSQQNLFTDPGHQVCLQQASPSIDRFSKDKSLLTGLPSESAPLSQLSLETTSSQRTLQRPAAASRFAPKEATPSQNSQGPALQHCPQALASSDDETEADVAFDEEADTGVVTEVKKEREENETAVSHQSHSEPADSRRVSSQTPVVRLTSIDSLLCSSGLQTPVEVPGKYNTRSKGSLRVNKTEVVKAKYPICDGKAYKDGKVPSGVRFDVYKCSQCDKEFFKKFDLVRHMKNPNCDGNDEAFRTPPIVKTTPRQSSSKDDEDWEPKPVDDDDQAGRDSEQTKRVKQNVNANSLSYEKGCTVAEFMTGKVRIRLREGGRVQEFTHYRCHKCCRVFITKPDHDVHMASIMKKDGCTRRQVPDDESLKILTEIKEQHTISCTKCSLLFLCNKHFEKHEQCHEMGTACFICGHGFASKYHLHRHLEIRKEKQKCNVCGFDFQAKCQMLEHIIKHSAEARKQCNICGESFESFSKDKIKRHRRSHKNAIECEICKESLPFRPSLIKMHMKTHQKSTAHQKNKSQTQFSLCSVCGKCLKTPNLSKHLLTHSDERPFPCTICKAAFKSKTELNTHGRRHGKKTKQCEFCGAKFHTTTSLKVHQWSHFGKRFRCEECGIRLITRKALNKHIDNVHKKCSRFVCSFCGLSLCDNTSLKQHMRSHTGEKPYQCKHCPAKFARRDYLNKHVRLHTGEKPYKCEDCGQSFAVMSGLKLHRQKHHSDKTYDCSICGAGFVVQSSLDFHVQRQHGFPSISMDVGAVTVSREVEIIENSVTVVDNDSAIHPQVCDEKDPNSEALKDSEPTS